MTITFAAQTGSQIFQSVSIPANSTISVYARAGTVSRFNIIPAGVAASPVFNLTSQWQRFSYSFAGTAPNFAIANVGTDAGTIDVAMPQAETGAFPTSYIPTTSVAVTRAQDVCQIPTNVSWYSAANYSLLAEFDTQNATAVVVGIASAFSDASYISASTWNVVGAVSGPLGVPAITVGSAINKECVSLAPSRLAISNNGGAVVSSGNGAPAQTAATRLSIGSSPWGLDNSMTGHMRHVAAWNRTLSDAEMQQATT